MIGLHHYREGNANNQVSKDICVISIERNVNTYKTQENSNYQFLPIVSTKIKNIYDTLWWQKHRETVFFALIGEIIN
jgi:hypothetical protein